MPRNLLTSLLAILAFLAHLPSALSVPHLAARGKKDWPAWNGPGQCLSASDASFLVNIMVSVSVSFDPAFVTPYFADDLTIQSDSINFLLGQPVSDTSPHRYFNSD